MRTFLSLVLVVITGLALGGVFSWYSIRTNHGFGALSIGEWTAWPLAGSQDSDPYTKAKVAADGEVPLGIAEGIAFHADKDATGQPLRQDCSYKISGITPPARLWTLTAHRLDGRPVSSSNGTPAVLVSRQLVRSGDGSFDIGVGAIPPGGNWLETQGEGPFKIILRLYDSQVTSARGIVEPRMPNILLLGCGS